MPGAGSTEDLTTALGKALSESVSKLDSNITNDKSNVSDQIELVVAS